MHAATSVTGAAVMRYILSIGNRRVRATDLEVGGSGSLRLGLISGTWQ